MDEIDREMEKMLTPKQVKTFQEYLGVQMAREPEPSVEEQIKDIQWENTDYHKNHWEKILKQFIAIEGVLWGLVVLASSMGPRADANLVIAIGALIALTVFIVFSVKDLVDYTEAEERFKNEK